MGVTSPDRAVVAAAAIAALTTKGSCLLAHAPDSDSRRTVAEAVQGGRILGENGSEPAFAHLLSKAPDKTPETPRSVTKDYVDWVLSQQGQCIILDKGYAPIRPINCS